MEAVAWQGWDPRALQHPFSGRRREGVTPLPPRRRGPPAQKDGEANQYAGVVAARQ